MYAILDEFYDNFKNDRKNFKDHLACLVTEANTLGEDNVMDKLFTWLIQDNHKYIYSNLTPDEFKLIIGIADEFQLGIYKYIKKKQNKY